MRIKCLTLEGTALESNKYITPKGNEHIFFKNSFTEIPDPEDAEYFLRAGNGKFFKAEGIVEKVKGAITSVLPNEPMKATNEDAPKTIEGSLFTINGIKGLNKRQQEFIIKAVRGKNTHLPKTEDERVEAIFKIQGEGHDISKILTTFA